MDPTETQLGQKAFMGHSIKHLTETEYPDVDLAFSIQVIHKLMGGKEKLGLTGMAIAEYMIGWCPDALVI